MKNKYIPILIFIFLALILFGNTLFPPEGKMIFGMDIYDAYFYWKNYLRESILNGFIPFWNPYNFSGTPFLAHPNINIFYPPNWLFVILPLNYSFAWYFFLHIVIAGINMYWLARQYTGRLGATAAAVIYSFSGFFAARIYSGHLEYVDAASWVPLAFGCTRNALLGPSKKKILLSALGLTVLLLAGNELFFLFTLELITLYILFLILNRRIQLRLSVIRYAKVLLVSLSVAFGLAACEILPRMEFIVHSIRSGGIPYSLAGGGAISPSGLWLFIKPFFLGMPFRDNYSYTGLWPNLFEFTYYVGIIPIIAAGILLLLTMVNKFRLVVKFKINKEIWFYLFLVIPFFVFISLGNNLKPNIHEFFWRFTPFYKGIRIPARHLFGVAFALSLSCGIIIGIIKSKILKVLLLLLITFDLLLFSRNFIRLTDLPTATEDSRLIDYLKKDTDVYRILPDFPVTSTVRRDFDFGAASLYRIPSTSDYNSMVLSRYYNFIDLLNKASVPSIPYYNVEVPPPNPKSSYINYLNVKYILSDKNSDGLLGDTSGNYPLLLDGERYRLYRNNNFIPRFFFVSQAQLYRTDQELGKALITDKDLAKTVLLKKNDLIDGEKYVLDCTPIEKNKVEIVSYSANSIYLRTNSSCNAFLSSSEVFYPGWQVKIDGQERKILLGNSAFRVIYLPKGQHSVEYYFSPKIYFFGLFITLFSLLLFWKIYTSGTSREVKE